MKTCSKQSSYKIIIKNIIDIVDMVNCILSDNRCDICFDISGDGFVDVVDIVDLVNIILDN